jgi:hypothetical protein
MRKRFVPTMVKNFMTVAVRMFGDLKTPLHIVMGALSLEPETIAK